jgi:hypothetical protein
MRLKADVTLVNRSSQSTKLPSREEELLVKIAPKDFALSTTGIPSIDVGSGSGKGAPIGRKHDLTSFSS